MSLIVNLKLKNMLYFFGTKLYSDLPNCKPGLELINLLGTWPRLLCFMQMKEKKV